MRRNTQVMTHYGQNGELVMKCTEIKPTGFLSHFVQCFWTYQNTEAAIEHTILPDGYFDLIAEFDNEVLTTVKRTVIWAHAITVKIPKNTTLFAIRFKLLANEYFFQQSIQSILNTNENLPLSFWNLQTYQQIDFERFVSETTLRLECAIQRLQKIDSRKPKLFELIYQQKENTVKALSKQVFWSARQMNRYFNRQFGHWIKALKKYTGVMPKALYKNENDRFLQLSKTEHG